MYSLLAAILTFAAPAVAPAPLRIAAAASFTDVLPKLKAAFKDAPCDLNFAATSRLATQIESGAPFDVFISADVEWADKLVKENLLAAPEHIASNQMIVAVPKGTLHPPKDMKDVAALQKITLAGENVPAGRYAQQALEKAGVWAEVEPHVVRAEHVRAALKWVELGEAEAAFVYATDIALDPEVVRAFTVDPALHEPIIYVAGAVVASPQGPLAKRFLQFLLSDTAQKILRDAGFTKP